MLKLNLLLLFVIICSCSNSHNNSLASHKKKNINVDTIEYTYSSYKDVSPYIIEHDNNLDSTYYGIIYPTFNNEALNQSLNPYIFLDGLTTPEESAEAFLLGYNEYVEDNETTSPHSWYKNIRSEVWTNTPLFVTLATSVDEYTGGAHGNHVQIITNVDISTNKKIELSDLFSSKNLDKLNKLAENQFRKNENITQSTPLDKDYFFENGIFAINNNFGFKKSKLVFYFNEYEIKPYSKGPTILEIPYSDIINILTPLGLNYIESLNHTNY